jgi:hypothetical protein
MIIQQRIPMNAAEAAAVDELLPDLPEGTSLCRNDPGESGPVRVDTGSKVYLVQDDGSVEEVSG